MLFIGIKKLETKHAIKVEWLEKLRRSHTMEYYVTIKKQSGGAMPSDLEEFL